MGKKSIDWSNKIFHNCIILEPVIINKYTGNDNWKIKCHCGKIFITSPAHLKATTKSCGCLTIIGIKERCKKYDYYNYIDSESKVQIIKPIDPLKDGCMDKWICLCPHHNPPKEFITRANNIVSKTTKSCGCIHSKKSSEIMSNKHKATRISKGLLEDEYLLEIKDLFRKMTCDSIKLLISKIDGYTCALCSAKKVKLYAHHINPIYNFLNYSDPLTYKYLYDLNNLITLCGECHQRAHKYYTSDIDIDIQKILFELTSKRTIQIHYKFEYDEIVKNKIEPWIEEYTLKLREKNV